MMLTRKSMTRFGVLGAVPLAALGLAGGVLLVQAQDSSPSTASAQAPAQASAMADEFVKRLAANLGMDEQVVREALEKTGLEMVDQAVTDGDIDQAMADKIKAMIESGATEGFSFGNLRGFGSFGGEKPAMPFGGSGSGFSAFGGFGVFGNSMGAITTFFGLSMPELMAEMTSGKSLGEIAEARGKSRADLKAFILAEATKAIDQALAEGKLTAEKAATAKAELGKAIDQALDMKLGDMKPGGVRPGSGMPFRRP